MDACFLNMNGELLLLYTAAFNRILHFSLFLVISL